MLNSPGHWDFFISHVQRECKHEALKIANDFGKDGLVCWLDINMGDKSEAAMKEGVQHSDYVLVILSEGYFKSEWCQKELRWAMEAKKSLILCHQKGCKVGEILQNAPHGISNIESVELHVTDPDYWDVCKKKLFRQAERRQVFSIESP